MARSAVGERPERAISRWDHVGPGPGDDRPPGPGVDIGRLAEDEPRAQGDEGQAQVIKDDDEARLGHAQGAGDQKGRDRPRDAGGGDRPPKLARRAAPTRRSRSEAAASAPQRWCQKRIRPAVSVSERRLIITVQAAIRTAATSGRASAQAGASPAPSGEKGRRMTSTPQKPATRLIQRRQRKRSPKKMSEKRAEKSTRVKLSETALGEREDGEAPEKAQPRNRAQDPAGEHQARTAHLGDRPFVAQRPRQKHRKPEEHPQGEDLPRRELLGGGAHEKRHGGEARRTERTCKRCQDRGSSRQGPRGRRRAPALA